MRKLLICLSVAIITGSPLLASTIDFSNQNYQTKYVDTYANGCNNFGTSLQQDLDTDPIIATVSANYNTSLNMGNVTVTAKSAHGQILSDTLPPLGLKNIYEFGVWHTPRVHTTINGHSYSIYATVFFTNGNSNADWISNGNQSFTFINPNDVDKTCTVYSRPQNTTEE